MTDPMIGFAPLDGGLLIDARTGTVYQTTTTGVWVVDVSPEDPTQLAT